MKPKFSKGAAETAAVDVKDAYHLPSRQHRQVHHFAHTEAMQRYADHGSQLERQHAFRRRHAAVRVVADDDIAVLLVGLDDRAVTQADSLPVNVRLRLSRATRKVSSPVLFSASESLGRRATSQCASTPRRAHLLESWRT